MPVVLPVSPARGIVGAFHHLSRCAVAAARGSRYSHLQTLPFCDKPFDDRLDKVAGCSLPVWVATSADERKKLERLCRHIQSPGGTGPTKPRINLTGFHGVFVPNSKHHALVTRSNGVEAARPRYPR